MSLKGFPYRKVTVNSNGELIALNPTPDRTKVDIAGIAINSIVTDPPTDLSDALAALPSNVRITLELLIPKSYRITVTNGQIEIQIPTVPSVPSTLELLVNGIIYKSPSINLINTTIYWANPDFKLESSDLIYVNYT